MVTRQANTGTDIIKASRGVINYSLLTSNRSRGKQWKTLERFTKFAKLSVNRSVELTADMLCCEVFIGDSPMRVSYVNVSRSWQRSRTSITQSVVLTAEIQKKTKASFNH